VAVFEAAVSSSPSKSVDVVIANAGVVGADDLFKLQGECRAPDALPATGPDSEQSQMAHPSSQI
jgi:hypothetical protein